MKDSRLVTALALPLMLALGACSESPLAPGLAASGEVSLQQGPKPKGSGLVVESLTNVSLPLVGEVGDVLVDQAVITNLRLLEDVAGQIIGLEATGTLSGVLTATGAQIDEQFTSTVSITSSGPGQCDLVTVDLGPLRVDALGLVTADVEEFTLSGRGSGAVGSLLCNLGSLVGGLTGGGAGGLVNAINNLL